MKIGAPRWTLGALGASALYVGLWAEFLPVSFYESFPGFGRHWIPVLGPYNDHLVRDVGGLYLALAVMSIGALWSADRRTTMLVAMAWEAFSVPHLIFHLFHLHHYGPLDQVLMVVSLAAVVVAAGALLLAKGQRSPSFADLTLGARHTGSEPCA